MIFRTLLNGHIQVRVDDLSAQECKWVDEAIHAVHRMNERMNAVPISTCIAAFVAVLAFLFLFSLHTAYGNAPEIGTTLISCLIFMSGISIATYQFVSKNVRKKNKQDVDLLLSCAEKSKRCQEMIRAATAQSAFLAHQLKSVEPQPEVVSV